MTKTERKEIRARLEEMRRQLSGRVRARAKELKSCNQNGRFSGSESNGDEASDMTLFKEMMALLIETSRVNLEMVALALQRLDEGEYEICSECGEHIPITRLRAVPTTTKCVKCQTRAERQLNRKPVESIVIPLDETMSANED